MKYLLFLQNLRLASASVLDGFMLKTTELGEPLITFLLLALIYWCIDKRSGQLMAFNVSFACWLNQWIKNVFKVERPWVRDARISPVEAAVPGATGYSMPSGHTTRVFATWGVAGACVYKNREISEKIRKCIALLLWLVVALVMFSRNYLGVHTFSDVFVALILGIVILFLSQKLLDWAERKQDGYRDIIVCIGACIIIFLPMLKFGCLSNAGTAFGFLIGWVLERRWINFSSQVSWERKVLRFIPGALVLFVCYTSGTTVMSHIVPEKYAGFFLNGFAAFFIIFIYPVLIWVFEEQCPNEGIRKKLKKYTALVMVGVILLCGIVGAIKVASHIGEFKNQDKISGEDTSQNKISEDGAVQNKVSAEDIKIIAHKGYSSIAPENTMASFERAMDIGVDMIELDVQMTKDGRLVVFHDDDISRITGQTGSISDYTYEEIRQMNAGSWFLNVRTGMTDADATQEFSQEKIPALEEVLKLVAENENVEMYLELKDLSAHNSLTTEQLSEFPRNVVDMVNDYGLANRVIFASFNYEYLKQIKDINSENRILCNTLLGDADVLLKQYPAEYYGLNIATIKQDTIAKIKAAGAHPFVYTVDEPAQMQMVKKLGAEGIVTDCPGLAKVTIHDEYAYLPEHYLGSMTVPALYDASLQEQYSGYVFQGFTKVGQNFVISAYDSTGTKNSILFLMDANGTLLREVDLGVMAHLGGIAYDESRDLLWFTGADGYIHAIRWSAVADGSYEGKPEQILFTYDTGLTKPDGVRAASFMAIDENILYAGTYVDGANGKIEGYNIERLLQESDGSKIEPDVCYDIPQRIQGVTFAHNVNTGEVTMIMTQGHEMDDAAVMTVKMSNGRTDYTQTDTFNVLCEGAEQPLMTAEGLYILFESAVRPYRPTSRVPSDQIWLLSIGDGY